MFHVRRSSLPSLTRQMEAMQVADQQKDVKLKQINQFLILKKIGEGTTAKVYLALDTNKSKYVAMKSPKKCSASPSLLQLNRNNRSSNGEEPVGNFYAESAYLAQFEREISLIRRLSHHPSIIGLECVLHCPQTNTAYAVLEFAERGSLKAAISHKQEFSDSQLSQIFRQVLLGLQFCHSEGVAHEDIKPSNLLLFKDGSVKISDFGICHNFESADTVIGSPAYQAPEVFFDDLDVTSSPLAPQIYSSASDSVSPSSSPSSYEAENEKNKDENILTTDYFPFEDDNEDPLSYLDPSKEDIWSLGVTLFETKFHTYPFSGDNFYEIANDIQQKKDKSLELEIPGPVSPELKDALRQMLQPDPRKRISVEKLLEHPFFAATSSSELVALPSRCEEEEDLTENLFQQDNSFSHKENVELKESVDDEEFANLELQMRRVTMKNIPLFALRNLKIEKISAIECDEGYSFSSVGIQSYLRNSRK